MRIREELEALRDKYRSLACQNRQVVQDVDALLQRIPEGWEMRPREPSEKMAETAEVNRIWQAIAKENWRAMWNACEVGDE